MDRTRPADHAAHLPPKMPLTEPLILSTNTVCAILDISRPTLYRWLALGKFPKPFKTPSGMIRWKRTTILDWVNAQKPT